MGCFVVGGSHPGLHVKLEFMNLVIGLTFAFSLWGGGGGVFHDSCI